MTRYAVDDYWWEFCDKPERFDLKEWKVGMIRRQNAMRMWMRGDEDVETLED